MAGFMFGWWAKERIMISLSINGLASEVVSDVTSVGALLFGIRYYFQESSLRSTLRAYGIVAVEPYFASIVDGGVVGTEVDMPVWASISRSAGGSARNRGRL